MIKLFLNWKVLHTANIENTIKNIHIYKINKLVNLYACTS